MSAISIRNLRKDFGQVSALKEVSLEVRSGEFMTLLGPSGSGKTTLLNILQGFESPDAGDVLLEGRDITRLPPSQRGFGMVFQSYALFPHMNVAENVGYPLRARHIDRRRRAEMVQLALDQVELSEYGDRRPDQLSGGQQQRVALARALVFQPPVLLMDEPLAALDRRLRQSLQLSLKELHQRIKATILYVTHDQEEALVLSDRVCVMRDGQIAQVGTPSEIYSHPADTFVASFLGETNLLTGDVVENLQDTALVNVDSDRYCQLRVAGQWSPGDHVVLSVRPEDVLVSTNPNGPDREGLAAVVRSCVFMGDVWRVKCETEQGTSVISRRGAAEGDIEEGASVTLTVRPQTTVVFHSTQR
jgi:putative spermidine/putrescine transport system ATP-binding protein